MTANQGFHIFGEGEVAEETKANVSRKYIIFELGKDKYAVALDTAREVIETPEFRPVPNTVPYFLGYFNLRGEVVGLIDLKQKFNIKSSKAKSTTAIIFDCGSGTLAALVDQIDKIATISSDAIERNPKIKSVVPQEYLEGISKVKELNVIFLNLKKILTDDDWIKVKAAEP